jgi:general secretion pathway protein C
MLFDLYSKWERRLKNQGVGVSTFNRISYSLFFVLFLCVFWGIFATLKNYLQPLKVVSIHKPTPSSASFVSKSVPHFDYILKRNIFNVDGILPESEYGENALFCQKEVPKSRLPLVVVGIIFGGTSETSLALVAPDSKTPPSLFKVGDSFAGGAQLKEIFKDKIYVSSKVCPEYVAIDLSLPRSSRLRNAANQNNKTANYQEPGFERIGNNTSVTRQWVDNILTNDLSSVLGQARAMPNIVNGQVRGFVLAQITPDSVYTKLGLKDGDVISAVNGIALNDAAGAIQTLNAMRVEDKIRVDVVRNGQPVQLNVSVQ